MECHAIKACQLLAVVQTKNLANHRVRLNVFHDERRESRTIAKFISSTLHAVLTGDVRPSAVTVQERRRLFRCAAV